VARGDPERDHIPISSHFNVIHPGMEMDLIFVSLARITGSPQVLDLGEDVFLNSGMQGFTFKMVVLQHRLASSFSMLEPFVHKWHIFG